MHGNALLCFFHSQGGQNILSCLGNGSKLGSNPVMCTRIEILFVPGSGAVPLLELYRHMLWNVQETFHSIQNASLGMFILNQHPNSFLFPMALYQLPRSCMLQTEQSITGQKVFDQSMTQTFNSVRLLTFQLYFIASFTILRGSSML